MRYLKKGILCLSFAFTLMLLEVPCASALMYDRGSALNDYAQEKPNEATSSIGLPDSGGDAGGTVGAMGAVVTDVESLLSADTYLDGARVEFSAEAIGDTIDAGDGYVWVNVGEGNSLIGVSMTREQSEEIRYFGRYGIEGSVLSIVGTFDIACDTHGGELDVHAEDVRIVSPGRELPAVFDSRKLYLGLALVAGGAILFYAYRRYRLASM